MSRKGNAIMGANPQTNKLALSFTPLAKWWFNTKLYLHGHFNFQMSDTEAWTTINQYVSNITVLGLNSCYFPDGTWVHEIHIFLSEGS